MLLYAWHFMIFQINNEIKAKEGFSCEEMSNFHYVISVSVKIKTCFGTRYLFLLLLIVASSLGIIEFMLRVFTNSAVVASQACRRLFADLSLIQKSSITAMSALTNNTNRQRHIREYPCYNARTEYESKHIVRSSFLCLLCTIVLQLQTTCRTESSWVHNWIVFLVGISLCVSKNWILILPLHLYWIGKLKSVVAQDVPAAIRLQQFFDNHWIYVKGIHELLLLFGRKLVVACFWRKRRLFVNNPEQTELLSMFKRFLLVTSCSLVTSTNFACELAGIKHTPTLRNSTRSASTFPSRKLKKPR